MAARPASPMLQPGSRGERLPLVLLALVVATGAVARFWNLNWDHGAYSFHPDEWALNQVVRNLGPDLNPHFYFYGTLPIYLYRATAEALGFVSGVDWLDPTRLPLVGRFYSALVQTALLPLIYIVGRRLFWPGAGVLAAAFASGSAILVQGAHFGTVDSLLTLFALGLLWISLRLFSDPRPRWYMLAGAVLGMALATKLTAATFVLMPLIAHFLSRRETTEPGKKQSQRVWPLLLLFGTAAGACLLLAPYYVLDTPGLWSAIVEQNAELDGAPLTYTLHFAGSTPYLFELSNLVVWSLGVPLGIAALAGWLWAAARCIRVKVRDERAAALLLVAWPTLYLLLIGTWQARFIRHAMPLVPFCCLFAAGALAALWRVAGDRARSRAQAKWVVAAVGTAVVLGTGLWGGAYASIYTSLDPRLAATAWIHANVTAGSRLVVEDKNDLVPVIMPGVVDEEYQLSPLPVASEDTPAKVDDFARALAQGDLIVVPNRRWSGDLPPLKQYALTGRYYSLLFSGRLGYAPAASFSDPPHLGSFSWSDDSAEETFQVFDHPTVHLFRNRAHLSEAAIRTLLVNSP